MRRHMGERPRQTKIVATLGLCPEAQWVPFLEKMVAAGTDVFRLNFSHVDENYAKEATILKWATKTIPDMSAPSVAVLGDLQGPKARIGGLPDDGLELLEGSAVRLHEGLEADDAIPIPTATFSGVVEAVKVRMNDGDESPTLIVFGDGEVVLAVESVSAHDIVATVVFGGMLKSRKGITVRGADIDLEAFSEKDRRDLDFCLDNKVDMVAVSFVRTAADIVRVREHIKARTGRADALPIIAKIETLSAIQNIDAILAEVDGIMIARGDLGVQLGVERVPGLQKRLARLAKEHGKPAIVATQMLESMMDGPTPSRAEATDVFNAILDGGDAVMLSGETSIGKQPCQVVETMDSLARHAEAHRRHPEWLKHDRKSQREAARANVSDPFVGRINEEFALTAVQFAEHIPARAVVCFTRTGGTPQRLSQYRPSVPLLAVCNQDSVARRLLLHFGVHPIVLRRYKGADPDFDDLVAAARSTLKENYGLAPGDAIVVSAGVNWPRGGTNIVRVMVEALEGA
jgi:pyruvate kinase